MDNSFLYCSILKFPMALDDPGHGADVFMMDLEDSVHALSKRSARAALMELDLRPWVKKGRRFGVRINSLSTIEGIRDLDVVHSAYLSGKLAIQYLQIPKVSSHHEVKFCRSLIRDLGPALKIFPLVETPEGVDDVERIASVSDLMLFGQADITSTMYRPNQAYLDYARGRFCVACARVRIPAIDTKGFENITDMVRFERDAVESKEAGFNGKAMIHPRQVGIVKKVFEISEEEVGKYQTTLSLYRENETGFQILDGQVIAPPFVSKAKMMLSLWGLGTEPAESGEINGH